MPKATFLLGGRSGVCAAGFAVGALLAAGPASEVRAIEWVLDGNGSWADAENWSPEGSPEGQDVLLGDDHLTFRRTVTLDGHWTVNSLVVDSAWRYDINPGTAGSGVTLTTGYLQFGNWDGDPTGADHRLDGIYIQIGDGTTPLDTSWWVNTAGNASWNLNNTIRLGEVRGIEGTHVNVSGDGNLRFSTTSNDYLGDWTLSSPSGQAPRKFMFDADNAAGHGTVTIASETNIHFREPGTSHAMNLHLDADVSVGISVLDPEDEQPITLNGNLTGTGSLRLGRLDNPYVGSTGYPGTLILNGSNNTHSGDVLIRINSGVQVDGNWTGAGNFNVHWGGTLSGDGHIGMAEDSEMDVWETHSLRSGGAIAPGTDGTVGTFTIGTEGNNNTITIRDKGRLLVDIDGTSADRLDIFGNLDISDSNSTIEFNILNGAAAATTETLTLVTYTGWLSGEFDNVVGLPDGWSLDYSTTGEINLLTDLSGPDILVGDMNGDGQIDFDDINPFMLALNDPSAYESQYGLDPNVAGDINDDGQLDFDDINPFVALLSGDASANVVPEPATLSLLALGGLAALARRRRMAVD